MAEIEPLSRMHNPSQSLANGETACNKDENPYASPRRLGVPIGLNRARHRRISRIVLALYLFSNLAANGLALEIGRHIVGFFVYYDWYALIVFVLVPVVFCGAAIVLCLLRQLSIVHSFVGIVVTLASAALHYAFIGAVAASV